MAITRINTFEAKSGQASELREFLSGVIDLIIDAPGCRSVELLVGHDDAGRLAIIEVWDSVEAHQASV
jgi:quinol monooxygenase YgiN